MSPEDAIHAAASTIQSLSASVTQIMNPSASLLTAFAASPTSTISFSSSSTTTSPVESTATARPGAKNGECQLLGPFALFIQGALGLLALLSLVFKRWRERPQRPVKIWAFDASKQVIGSALLHIANLLMSMISSGEFKPKADDYQANPCSFYLLNLAIDTTLGIPILIFFLRILTYTFARTPFGSPPESIQSGNYGHPPKVKWWLKQCFIYFIGLLGMKFCVFVIFQLCPWIIRVGDWALRWTEGDERVQVFFVMLFFPVVMNALQYYIIDSFIKQKPADHENETNAEDQDSEDGFQDGDERGGVGAGAAGEERRGRRRRSRSRDRNRNRGLASEDEAVLTKNDVDVNVLEDEDKTLPADRVNKNKNKDNKSPKDKHGKIDEYNPETDGAASAGGSSDNEPPPPTTRRDRDGLQHLAPAPVSDNTK